jgi:amino acid transporter
VFFSYLGFDMVSCLSEEVIDPATTMPAGIIGSLLLSVLIYVSVSLVVVGMVPLEYLGPDVPLTNAFLSNACCSHSTQVELLTDTMQGLSTCLDYSCSPIRNYVLFYGSRIISFAAMFGLTTATFTCLMGQPRIFYRMAQDGLFFKVYAKINHKTGVPTEGTILTGIFTALAACFIDLESLANAISLGTLQVFTLVNAGIVLLRIRNPADFATGDIGGSEISMSQREIRSSLSDSIDSVTSRRDDWILAMRSTVTSRLDGITRTKNVQQRAVLTLASFVLSSIVVTVLLSTEKDHRMLTGTMIVLASCSAGLLFVFPKAPPPKTFQCPCVPLVPILGMGINCYMMGSFELKTWLMVLFWVVIGLVVYFSYGIHHSELNVQNALPSPSRPEKECASTANVTSPLLSSPSADLYQSIPA